MVPIPNLSFSEVRFDPASLSRVTLVAENLGIKSLHIAVNASDFAAQFGFGETPEHDNAFSGTIDIYGRTFSLPTDGLGLNPFPDYNYTFEKELRAVSGIDFSSRESLFDCDTFERVRALNVARLLILNMGSVTQESHDEYLKGDFKDDDAWLPNRWPNCGFSSNRVRMRGRKFAGETGALGELHFIVNGCKAIWQTDPGAYPEDCLGVKTVFEGNVTITGSQSIQGRLKTYARFFHDIVPNHPRAINFSFDDVSFDHFSSYYLSDNNKEPEHKLVLHSGSLSAKVHPVLSPKKGSPCEFFRATPVVGFDIRVKNKLNAELYLLQQGFAYSAPLVIDDAHILAQNGVYQGAGNSLSGTITINGERFAFRNEKLNPNYNQKDFDLSYECRERFPNDNEFSIEHIIPFWQGWKPDCRYE